MKMFDRTDPATARAIETADYTRRTETAARDGWVSARNGKWHRATVPEPTFMRDEDTACGLTFRPLNVTWHGERPPALARYLCQRPGCARSPAR